MIIKLLWQWRKKMKRILSLLALGLFLVSMVPVAVLAETPTTVAELITAREDARERTQEFKDRYHENRGIFNDKRLELRDRRSQYAACKADFGEDSAECQAKKDELKATSKGFMSSGLNMMIPWLESGRANLDSWTFKDDRSSQVQEALAYIDEDLQDLQDLKARVDAMSDTPSDEDVKNLGQELALAIRKARLDLKYGAGIVVRYRFDTLFERLGGTNEGTYGALDATYNELLAQGKDVSAIGDYIADMKAEVELAEQAYNDAIVDYDQARLQGRPATTRDEAKAAYDIAKDGFDNYKLAKEHLRLARDNLRQAVLGIKEQGGQEILEDNVETYILGQ